MYCVKCGASVGANPFCPQCGTAVSSQPVSGQPSVSLQQIPPSQLQEPVYYGAPPVMNDPYPGVSEKYRRIFVKFDQNGNSFTFTWNWWALWFGIIWYFTKGMWAKPLAMLVIGVVFGGAPAIVFWIYSAVFGNYDYYLLKKKGTQFW